jgi:hypothetical protein
MIGKYRVSEDVVDNLLAVLPEKSDRLLCSITIEA